jgi:hypothetical protein
MSKRSRTIDHSCYYFCKAKVFTISELAKLLARDIDELNQCFDEGKAVHMDGELIERTSLTRSDVPYLLGDDANKSKTSIWTQIGIPISLTLYQAYLQRVEKEKESKNSHLDIDIFKLKIAERDAEIERLNKELDNYRGQNEKNIKFDKQVEDYAIELKRLQQRILERMLAQ